MRSIVVAGGGIGGLATALAWARLGGASVVYERRADFGEFGAGIQLGPNATRLLQAWGLEPQARRLAAIPSSLVVRQASSTRVLAEMPLNPHMSVRYGAPYFTMARADLHGLLLKACEDSGLVTLNAGQGVAAVLQNQPHEVVVTLDSGAQVCAGCLVGADGVWSQVRASLAAKLSIGGNAQATGHLAYRALLNQATLPAALRSRNVTVWMGPHLHVVHYPVNGGAGLNIVALYGRTGSDTLPTAFNQCAPGLRNLLAEVPHWQRWDLYASPPLSGPQAMANGRVALLGDAAHAMRPYLAQGAGMALEDAQTLAQCLSEQTDTPVAEALQRYAQQRWQRNARVQRRADRNGRIFHLQGPMAWLRNQTLRCMGPAMLDIPWLYRQ
jgi:salicylate hydroxylase